MLTETSK